MIELCRLYTTVLVYFLCVYTTKDHKECSCAVYLPEPSSVAAVDLAWPISTRGTSVIVCIMYYADILMVTKTHSQSCVVHGWTLAPDSINPVILLHVLLWLTFLYVAVWFVYMYMYCGDMVWLSYSRAPLKR